MRLLLDTHTLLWFLLNDPRLSPTAKALIRDPANDVSVSVASCWEMAIKSGIGKLKLAEPCSMLLARELPANMINLLPIELEHATSVESLPHHHRDPFDRLIIAQSISESLTVVGADTVFDQYGVTRIW